MRHITTVVRNLTFGTWEVHTWQKCTLAEILHMCHVGVMTTTVKLTPRGTVTLPRAFRRQYVLKANDLLIAETTDQGILLRPASMLPTELYSEERLAEFEAANNRAIAKFFPDRRRSKG